MKFMIIMIYQYMDICTLLYCPYSLVVLFNNSPLFVVVVAVLGMPVSRANKWSDCGCMNQIKLRRKVRLHGRSPLEDWDQSSVILTWPFMSFFCWKIPLWSSDKGPSYSIWHSSLSVQRALAISSSDEVIGKQELELETSRST